MLAVSEKASFIDVDDNAYYANAVAWAEDCGVVNGISENEFAPDRNITREQLAAIMYRFAQHMGYDVSVADTTDITSYSDYDEIYEYAIVPMKYVVGAGILNGKTLSTLNPKDYATRAEIATILHRFIEANK